jgi:hypothetical protein
MKVLTRIDPLPRLAQANPVVGIPVFGVWNIVACLHFSSPRRK